MPGDGADLPGCPGRDGVHLALQAGFAQAESWLVAEHPAWTLSAQHVLQGGPARFGDMQEEDQRLPHPGAAHIQPRLASVAKRSTGMPSPATAGASASRHVARCSAEQNSSAYGQKQLSGVAAGAGRKPYSAPLLVTLPSVIVTTIGSWHAPHPVTASALRSIADAIPTASHAHQHHSRRPSLIRS